MVYYLFFIKNDNIVLRTILKFGGEYMFEFSTNFKKINGDRLTLSLIEEKLPTDFESLPYYYFDIIFWSMHFSKYFSYNFIYKIWRCIYVRSTL